VTKIMLLGDTHGNIGFVRNRAIPAAKAAGCRWIYQVGDFGYWEHTPEGVQYLNDVQESLVESGIHLVFIAGNHDKTSLIVDKYPMIMGFYAVRPSIWFAPNGVQWDFEGYSFLALGGAYSIDKQWRLEQEAAQAKNRVATMRAHYEREGYSESYMRNRAVEKTAETLWFPEEEMTDLELEKILIDIRGTRIDVILAHDKPFASNPGVKLSPIPECEPNQRRLQKAVNILQPKLFVHGHLHIRYTDTIRCGDGNAYTRVEGLGADVPNFNQTPGSWEPSDAWEILDLEG
jgi:predicted phosphodiesterase